MKKQIKIYSTPSCPYCILAKDFFRQNNLPFEDIDLSKDEKAAEEIIRRTGLMSVPIIEIGDEIIAGFDIKKIKEALKRKQHG